MFNIDFYINFQLYRDLTYVSRDGMSLVIGYLNQIALEKYSKLHDSCRTQVSFLLIIFAYFTVDNVNIFFNIFNSFSCS